MITYEASKQGYINLWSKAVIRSQYVNSSKAWATKISANRSKLDPIEEQTGVVWFFPGLLLMRESSLNFNTYLGNGQPLNHVTTITPAGRGPWKTFADGAIDALKLQGFVGIKDWPISRILWAAEVFNGQGYFAQDINSPYLWSWTNQYTAGKFSSDGVYDPSLVDPQPGIAAVLGSLIVTDPDVAEYLAAYKEEPVTETPTPTPPPVPEPVADPYAPIIAMLKAAGKLPTPTINITTTGEVTIILNGKQVS